jgi:hypothetical protein
VLVVELTLAGSLLVFMDGARLLPPSTTCMCPPYELDMDVVGSSHPAPGVYDVELEIVPTRGMTTGIFALDILNSSQTSDLRIPPGTAPATCAAPSGGTVTAFTPTNCGPPIGSWYAVLVSGNTTVASVFDSSVRWSGATVTLNDSLEIYVVSDSSYGNAGYTIAAYGTDSHSVAGSAFL